MKHRKHFCLTAWLYLILGAAAASIAIAAEGQPESSVPVNEVTQIVMQGGLGAFALAELAQWRNLGAQFINLLDAALGDLRSGKMTVRHEHVDIDGHEVERRRPARSRSVRDVQTE